MLKKYLMEMFRTPSPGAAFSELTSNSTKTNKQTKTGRAKQKTLVSQWGPPVLSYNPDLDHPFLTCGLCTFWPLCLVHNFLCLLLIQLKYQSLLATTLHLPNFLATFWRVPGLYSWTSVCYLCLFSSAFILMTLNSVSKLMTPKFY